MSSSDERRGSWSDGLHVAALFNLAVAHPLYDVIAGNTEFLLAHRAGWLDLVLFVLLVSFVLPAVVVVVARMAGRVSRVLGRAAIMAAVLALTTALAAQFLEQAGFQHPAFVVALAFAAGAGAVFAYVRVPPARIVSILVGAGALVVPLLFLLRPSVRPFLVPATPEPTPSVRVQQTPPIVIVVFDQLPLTSLLDGSGHIDAQLYPGFGALANEATWFRNTTAVADFTAEALPSILTGTYPHRSALPTAAEYPRNLFTLLGNVYRLRVFEPITALCPETLCPPDRGSPGSRLRSMVLDSGLVYARIVAPAGLESTLPSVSEGWNNFAADLDWQQRWIGERDADRRAPVEEFVRSIRPDAEQPTLYFLHLLLPHEPYVYARSGQRFTSDREFVGLNQSSGRWEGNAQLVARSYQAHLLQVSYTDAVVGRIVDRLKETGIYDRALVVVTADHGASFRPGSQFKGFTRDTMAETAGVPLLVKRPGQRVGSLSDQNAQTVDIVPTVLDVLGARAPTDGISLFDDRADRPVKITYSGGGRFRRTMGPSILSGLDDAVARKRAIFRDGDPDFPVGVAPYPVLLGRNVADFAIGRPAEEEVRIDQPKVFEAVDLNSDLLPADIRGTVQALDAPDGEVRLAVGVNGIIRATTVAPRAASSRWSALIPPESLRSGWNNIGVFAVEGSPEHPTLRPAFVAGQPVD